VTAYRFLSEEAKDRARDRAREGYRKNREKRIAQAKEWRDANADRVRELATKRRRADLEGYNAYQRDWRMRNPEAANASFRAWKKRNPEAVAAMARRHRARVRGAAGTVTAAEWRELLVEFDYRCAYCNIPSSSLEMDHMQPVSRGGDHLRENVVPACLPCNRRKGTRTALEFLSILTSPPLKGLT
jgi:5-methylcytosine-specific restriction endonuclease McrA